MKNFLSVVDDGTMDTVFECEHCRKEIRYSEIERDDYGITEEAFSQAEKDHEEECEGPEDTSHAALAERWHGGQFLPLYAFSSTGTIVEGLAGEIRSCVEIAEKRPDDHHPIEISALKEFLVWAEEEEAKKFPNKD